MSELEKKLRSEYQRKRKLRMILIGAAACLLILAFLLSLVTWKQMQKNSFITYTEKSTVDHTVYIDDRSFFESDSVPADFSYISSIVRSIAADFTYDLAMDTDRATFKYNYSITATLQMLDRDSKAPLYAPEYVLLAPKEGVTQGNSLSIKEKVDIDFDKYNQQAFDFIEAYKLSNTSTTLIVTLYVDVVGECDQLAADNSSSYSVSLNIPLTKETFYIESEASVNTAGEKMLACPNSLQNVFRILTLVFAPLALLAVVAFVLFTVLTRDKHIDYARKVKSIIANYHSYIQKIGNEFSVEGYQILRIATITEMLDLRDTLQKPILMYENEDKTCSKFYIPTDTHLLYLYEIAVEGLGEDAEPDQATEQDIID